MSVTDPEASAGAERTAPADSLQESESTALARQGSHFDPAPAGPGGPAEVGTMRAAAFQPPPDG